MYGLHIYIYIYIYENMEDDVGCQTLHYLLFWQDVLV